ncbi:hypothetical protein ACFLSJ_00725 [Verrucomicrobiota bacterium]
MRLKRSLGWGLVVLSAALFAWRSLHFSYDPARLYRAVPMNATFIAEQDRLADEWPVFVRSSALGAVLKALDADGPDVRGALCGKDAQGFVRRFASRKTVVAFVPNLGQWGAPAWVLASWAGAQAQFLRWGLYSQAMTGFDKRAMSQGRSCWSRALHGYGYGTNACLSVAVVEGVLLACLSSDRTAVSHLVDRIERGNPIAPPLQDRLASEEGAGAGVTHRGWVIRYVFNGEGLRHSQTGYALTELGETRCEGWVRWETGQDGTGPAEESVAGVHPPRLPSDAPAALLVAPLAQLLRWIGDADPPPVVTGIGEALEAAAPPDGMAFACLCTSEYSGRIFGIRAPTFLVGVQIRDPNDLQELVASAMDRINADHKWCLIPRTATVGDKTVLTLDSVGEESHLRLNADERPALFVEGGWLMFASNTASLPRLLPLGGNAGWPRSPQPWLAELARRDAAAFAWLDLRTSGSVLGTSLALYDLTRYMQGARDGVSPGRRNMELLKQWIEAAGHMGTLALWLGRLGEHSEVAFSVGSAPADGKDGSSAR